MKGPPDMADTTPLASYIGSRLRVVLPYPMPPSGLTSYRREGFEFGLHAIEITMPELGADLDAAVEKALSIATDPFLAATLVREDGGELELDEAGIAAVQADLAAARVALGRCKHCGRSAD